MPTDEQASAKLDAILAGMAGISSRMDAMESDIKVRKDAEEKARKDAEEAKGRFDSVRKDRFGARKDGESYKDYSARHDADEAAMLDALKDQDDCEKSVKDARRDAEADEAKKDEGFEKWAKKDSDPGEEEEKAAEERAEKDRKDAAEMERSEAIKDQARKDAAVSTENAELKARLASMENVLRGLTTETPAADRDALARAQSRADSVAAMFGERAPQPFPGERPLDYRKRALGKFQRHSERFKDSRLDGLDDATLSATEEHVYHDATLAARAPLSPGHGRLIPRTERVGGRDLTTYTGDPRAWMGAFMTGAQSGDFVRPQNRSH